MSEWLTAPFGELYLEGSRNGISVSKAERGFGVPMVNMKELYANDFIMDQYSDLVPIDESQADKWSLNDGDLLFGRRSLTLAGAGKVSIVRHPPHRAVFESSMIRVRLDTAKASSSFYYYLFKSPPGRQIMETIVEQVAVAGIRSSDLARLGVPVPRIDEQRRIASVLGAFDDLIEANRLQVVRLEQLARMVAASSPEDVELGEFARALDSRQVRPAGPVEHYSLPAFDEGAEPERVDGGQIQSNKLALTEPCVLISRLNPRWERCWMAYPGANAVASTEFVPLVGREATPEEVWAVTSAPAFWEHMRTHVTGTTGSHQRVDKSAVLTLTVPDVRTLDKSTRRHVQHVVRGARAVRDEIAELTRARDELLPLLMSGQVRVSEDLAVA